MTAPTLRDIEKLVSQGEHSFLEFKHRIHFPEKVARELVAFANTSGGVLLIGVDDDKKITGVKNPDEEVFVLEQLIKTHIKYPIQTEIHRIPFTSKREIIFIRIPEARNKPNFVLQKPGHKYGQAFVRVSDRSIQASKEMVQIMRMRSHSDGPGITFGDHELSVLRLFSGNEKQTVKKVAEYLLLDEQLVSGILVKLVTTGVLEIYPREGGDFFMMVKN